MHLLGSTKKFHSYSKIMGLFSKLLGSDETQGTLNQQEAFLAVLLSVVAADGHISDSEIDDFNSAVNKAHLLENVSSQEFKTIISKLFKILKRGNAESLAEMGIGALPERYYLGTFALACDLIFSDGAIEKEEEMILESIKVKMRIEDGLATKIVEVISLKNKL